MQPHTQMSWNAHNFLLDTPTNSQLVKPGNPSIFAEAKFRKCPIYKTCTKIRTRLKRSTYS